jgi:2-aminoethylphosphonate-pyruvate transaminase
VNVRPEVAAALTEYEIGHREDEFCALLAEVRENALAVAGIRDRAAYSAVVITGSGTAGNEAVLSSVVPNGEPVLCLVNGEFSGRLAQISRMYNSGTAVLEHAWGEPLDLAKLEERLSSRRVSLVTMTHHETSTGMLNPVVEVGTLCKRHGARLFVDAVSSFSADPLDLERGHVTFVSTSSGKALASYPGIALVIGRRDEFEKLTEISGRNYYLDLHRYYTFAEGSSQTPTTPAVPLVLALNRALELVLAEGLGARMARIRSSALEVRARLRRRGLKLLDETATLSSVVTCVRIPQGTTFETLRRGLRAEGFIIYGGKGPLADKIFQISTIGEVDAATVDRFFAVLDGLLGTSPRPARFERSARV